MRVGEHNIFECSFRVVGEKSSSHSTRSRVPENEEPVHYGL